MTEAAYRTSDPTAVTLWQQYQTDRQDAVVAFKAFAASIGPDYRPAIFDSHTLNCVGLLPQKDQTRPDGPWRSGYLGRQHVWVPHRTTKAGKALAASIEALPRIADVRDRLPGMPGSVIIGTRWLRPSLGMYDGALYAGWSVPIEEALEQGTSWSFSKAEKVDHDIWERIKLSQFYAAKEASGVDARSDGLGGAT